MDKIKEWIKNNPIKFLLLLFTFLFIVFVIFVIPFIINELYINNKGYLTKWGAEDVLAYHGNVLSFLGTVILGALALYQNYKLSLNNDEYSKTIRAMELKANMPVLEIPVPSEGSNGKLKNYHFKIRNISCNPAQNIQVSNFEVYDTNNTLILTSKSVSLSDTSMFGNDEITVKYTNSEICGDDLTIILFIEYTDKFNTNHKIQAKGLIKKGGDDFQGVKFDFVEIN